MEKSSEEDLARGEKNVLGNERFGVLVLALPFQASVFTSGKWGQNLFLIGRMAECSAQCRRRSHLRGGGRSQGYLCW